MKQHGNLGLLVPVFLAACVFAGCRDEPSIGYYLSDPRHLRPVRRVAFPDLGECDCPPGIADQMTVALAHALQGKRLFDVSVIPQEDPACRLVSLKERSGFSMEQLRDMRRAFQCDGILIGEVRNFRPYPATRTGLYLRLMDLRNGRLIWAIDHVWDTRDKATEKRIRRFFRKEIRSGYRPINWELGMMSPKIFLKFVAHEAVGTLPGGAVAAPPKR